MNKEAFANARAVISKMNVYDFDKTIYRGDSTVDFFLFSLRRHPSILLLAPKIISKAVSFGLGKCDKTEFKQTFFSFLTKIPEIEKELSDFWDSHIKNIDMFYLSRQMRSDVIISASPEFLLTEICKRAGIINLIASRVDSKTGEYTGKNCHGEEKVVRFRKIFGNAEVDEFYSDSYSDTPMAKIAKKAFIVDRGEVAPWDFSKKK